jgi:hypothetical protein
MSVDEIKAKTEQLRVTRGYWLAIGGLIVTAALIVILVFVKQSPATDVVAIAGVFTSVFGTVIGIFFGVQVGSAERAKVDDQLTQEKQIRQETQKQLGTAQHRLQMLFAKMDPQIAGDLVKAFPDLAKVV